MNIPPVAGELDNPTLARLGTVVFSATSTAGIVYAATCVGAYLSFGNITPKDLLSNYEANTVIDIARVGMALVCTAFYPLLVQPVRAVLMGWAEAGRQHIRKRNRSDQSGPDPVENSLNTAPLQRSANEEGVDANPMAEAHSSSRMSLDSWQSGVWLVGGTDDDAEATGHRRPSTRVIAHAAFTFLIGGAALAVAISVESLATVFSLSGASGFALVCNICPAFLYLALAPDESMSFTWLLAVVLGIFGIIMMPVCITANLIH